jgi:hypothetical protein
VDKYILLTVLGRQGEAEADFALRLSGFWTGVLRDRPDDFEKVYAESTRFEARGNRPARQYLAEAAVAATLEARLRDAGLDFEPIDRDDLYSKYEASGADWMQIEH